MILLQKDERKRLIGAAGAYKEQGKYAADRGRTVRQFKALGVLLVLSGLTGCAQVISGDTQDIVVQSEPRGGARCMLQNARGTWSVLSTPATLTLLRSKSDLTVSCKTDDGWTGSTSVTSQMSTLAYADSIPVGIGTAVDSMSGAAFDYPDRIVVPLAAPPVVDDRPHFGVEGGRGIAQPIDPAADRDRAAADNVITRFQTLRVLLDEGLITRDEYNTRRGANLGALLRYSLTPPARDLTRPAPAPETLVMRLRYLASAYAEHSISASEQAAERAVILNGLLPASAIRRADPPPPITDEMQMAAEIGRIERLKVASVITDAEAAKETAKVKQLLDASVAAADAAARAAAGLAALPAGAAAPVTGAGIALSTHTTEAQARRAWAGLQKAHPAELGTLKLSLKKIPRPHRPTHYQIVAGPLPDKDAAIALCKSLRRGDLSCDAATYSE
jgi:hypothetical protein